MASVPRAAQLLGVDKTTIYRWLRDGFITGQQPTPGAPWRIRIDQALRDRIQPAVPDGWLPLDQAAKILGISRQTVLHKVQTGQLTAVHVTRGRRKGLRIQVEHQHPGLFDTPRPKERCSVNHDWPGALITDTSRPSVRTASAAAAWSSRSPLPCADLRVARRVRLARRRASGQRGLELREVRAERARGLRAVMRGAPAARASASMRSSMDSCACVAYRAPPCRW